MTSLSGGIFVPGRIQPSKVSIRTQNVGISIFIRMHRHGHEIGIDVTCLPRGLRLVVHGEPSPQLGESGVGMALLQDALGKPVSQNNDGMVLKVRNQSLTIHNITPATRGMWEVRECQQASTASCRELNQQTFLKSNVCWFDSRQ